MLFSKIVFDRSQFYGKFKSIFNCFRIIYIKEIAVICKTIWSTRSNSSVDIVNVNLKQQRTYQYYLYSQLKGWYGIMDNSIGRCAADSKYILPLIPIWCHITSYLLCNEFILPNLFTFTSCYPISAGQHCNTATCWTTRLLIEISHAHFRILFGKRVPLKTFDCWLRQVLASVPRPLRRRDFTASCFKR